MLDRLIMWVAENDLQQTVYNMPGYISMPTAIIFCLWYGKKIGYKLYKSLLIFLIFRVFESYAMQFAMFMNAGFVPTRQANIATAFVYIPIIAWITSKIFRESYDSTSDFMAFPMMILYCIGRLGCLFPGCCYGYPCSWGIYNPKFDYKVFPVQILESLVALALIILMLYLSKKRKFVPSGELLPMLLTVYGALRFLIEFLHDNEKVLLGCSKLAFHALFMCAVGAVLWTLKRKKNKEINENGGPLCATELQN